MNFISILYSVGILQALLLMAALVYKTKLKPLTYRFLFLILLWCVLLIGSVSVFHEGIVWKCPHLSRLHVPFSLFIGPLVFLFLRFLVDNKHAWHRRYLLHFIPGLLFIIYFSDYLLLSAEQKLIYLRSLDNALPMDWYFNGLVFRLHFVIYLVFSYRLVDGYESTHLVKWVKTILLTMGGLIIILIYALFFQFSKEAMYIGPFAISLLLYVIAYQAITSDKIRVNSFILKQKLLEDHSLEKPDIRSKLEQVLIQKQGYKNPELTLSLLAAEINESAHTLSKFINDLYEVNFSEFINQQRIELAKMLLHDPKFDHYSIIGIGFEVGFNSKSSFYAAFKKQTGMTPLVFKNNKKV